MFKNVLLLLWACCLRSTEAVGVAVTVAAGGQATKMMRSQGDAVTAAPTPGTPAPTPANDQGATTTTAAAAIATPAPAATATADAPTAASEKTDLKIFVYDLPKSLNSDLVACYKSFASQDIWDDFREEKGQNSADIWVHKLLEKHSSRTMDPYEADVFYIPFYGFLSSFFSGYPYESEAGPSFSAQQGCSGKGHIHRVFELSDFLDASPHFKTKPERHVMTVSFWAVARKSLEPMKAPPSVITGPLFEKLQHSTLLIHEPLFSSMVEADEYKHYSGKLITIPYVAKPTLTDNRLANSSGHREISFYFQGSITVSANKGSKSLASRAQLAHAFEGVPGAMIKDTMKHYAGNSYEVGMTHSSFCLVLEGDTPTSARLFDSIAAGCVPLILSDAISLPFTKQLDWTKFSVHPQEGAYKAKIDASLIANADMENGKYKLGLDAMRHMPNEKLLGLQEDLGKVRESFIYGHGTPDKFTAGGAIELIINEIQRVMNDVQPSTAQRTIDQLNKDFGKILPGGDDKKL